MTDERTGMSIFLLNNLLFPTCVYDHGWTVKPDTDSAQSGEQQADCRLTKREAYSLCEAFHQPNPHAFFCGTYGDFLLLPVKAMLTVYCSWPIRSDNRFCRKTPGVSL